MDVDSAATFLASTILIVAGLLTLASGVLLLNNLFSRFWKPLSTPLFNWYPNTNARFAESHEMVEPKNDLHEKK